MTTFPKLRGRYFVLWLQRTRDCAIVSSGRWWTVDGLMAAATSPVYRDYHAKYVETRVDYQDKGYHRDDRFEYFATSDTHPDIRGKVPFLDFCLLLS